MEAIGFLIPILAGDKSRGRKEKRGRKSTLTSHAGRGTGGGKEKKRGKRKEGGGHSTFFGLFLKRGPGTQGTGGKEKKGGGEGEKKKKGRKLRECNSCSMFGSREEKKGKGRGMLFSFSMTRGVPEEEGILTS